MCRQFDTIILLRSLDSLASSCGSIALFCLFYPFRSRTRYRNTRMYACMHACMHARMHACVRACVRACLRACTYACVCASVHAARPHARKHKAAQQSTTATCNKVGGVVAAATSVISVFVVPLREKFECTMLILYEYVMCGVMFFKQPGLNSYRCGKCHAW